MSLGEGGSVRTDGRESDRWRPLLPGCVEKTGDWKTVTCVQEAERVSKHFRWPDNCVFPAGKSLLCSIQWANKSTYALFHVGENVLEGWSGFWTKLPTSLNNAPQSVPGQQR